MRIWVVWKLNQEDEYRYPVSFHKKEDTAVELCEKRNKNPQKKDYVSFYVLCHQVVD